MDEYMAAGCQVKKEKDDFSQFPADPIPSTSGQEQTIIKQEQHIMISSCTSLTNSQAWDQMDTNTTVKIETMDADETVSHYQNVKAEFEKSNDTCTSTVVSSDTQNSDENVSTSRSMKPEYEQCKEDANKSDSHISKQDNQSVTETCFIVKAETGEICDVIDVNHKRSQQDEAASTRQALPGFMAPGLTARLLKPRSEFKPSLQLDPMATTMAITKRASNFTILDKMQLCECVERHKGTLENKRTDAVSTKEKDALWVTVAEEFNAVSSVKRQWRQLKTCWENLKKTTKKKVASEKAYAMGTGGGPAYTPNYTELEEKVLAIIGLFLEAAKCSYDDDAAYGTVLNATVVEQPAAQPPPLYKSEIECQPAAEEDMVVTPVRLLTSPSPADVSSTPLTSSSVPIAPSTSAAISSTPTRKVRYVGGNVCPVKGTSSPEAKKQKVTDVHNKVAAVAVEKTALLEKQSGFMSRAEVRAEELHDLAKREANLRIREANLRIKSLKMDIQLKKEELEKMGISYDTDTE